MVTMVPLVYEERSEARNTTLAAISSTARAHCEVIIAAGVQLG
jgi:hypothetical protein